jgi:hypothetical protein
MGEAEIPHILGSIDRIDSAFAVSEWLVMVG